MNLIDADPEPDSTEPAQKPHSSTILSTQLEHPLAQQLLAPVEQWATLMTSGDIANRDYVIRSKMTTVLAFFVFAGQPPQRITPAHLFAWQQQLRLQKRADTTIYSWISRISSFYDWLRKDPVLAEQIPSNPVLLARPRAPVPYAGARPLYDSDLERLIGVIHDRAEAGEIVGRRDYALLLFYILTGMSRTEVLRLRWKNVQIDPDALILNARGHSGITRTRAVKDPSLRESLLDYLAASGRLDVIQADDPLWIRHDYGVKYNDGPLQPLTVQAVDKAMRRYATQADIDGFHIHRLRHSYARMAGEELDAVDDVRAAMGHRMVRTTHQLLSQIRVEPDRVSRQIAERLGLHDTPAEPHDEP